MSNHTPGPWHISDRDLSVIEGVRHATIRNHKDGTVTTKQQPYKMTIAETCGYQQMREANARLIAAAPDMLGMLQHYIVNVAGADDQTQLLFEKQVADLLAKVEA